MKKIFIKAHIEKSSDEKSYRFLASTSTIDRQGDSIDQSGWELKNFMKNPVILWAHRYDELPLGKVVELSVTENGLESEMVFADHEKAKEVSKLVDDGMLNAVSVGFIPKERNGNVITRAELLEISIVPVPANQEALALAYKELSPELQKDFSNFVKDLDTPEETEQPTEEVTDNTETTEVEEKSGRVISKKNRKALETALESAKTFVSELEKLLSIDEVATTDDEEVEGKFVVIERSKIEDLKFLLRSDKSKEKALNTLKEL